MTSAGGAHPSAPITGLSHVQLLVSDVSASAKWYSAVLGLVPFADDPDIGYVALQHRGGKFVVVLTRAASPGPRSPGPRSPGPRSPGPASDGLDHLALAVPDGAALEGWAAHLTDVGIDHGGVVLEGGHPSLQLRDPDGIAIELVAP
jgi:catechol 2,3-dioxygenase-like lactoylglutathione lyase family enzyme